MSVCDEFKMLFSDYLDSELPLTQRKQVDQHLNECPECSETVRQMKIIQQSLRQIPQLTTSPDFERKLHEHIFTNPIRPGFIPAYLQNWKVPAMGSALVLATISFFLIFNNGGDNPRHNNSQFIPAAPQISSPIKSTTSAQAPAMVSSGNNQTTLAGDSLKPDSAKSYFKDKKDYQMVNGKRQ